MTSLTGTVERGKKSLSSKLESTNWKGELKSTLEGIPHTPRKATHGKEKSSRTNSSLGGRMSQDSSRVQFCGFFYSFRKEARLMRPEIRMALLAILAGILCAIIATVAFVAAARFWYF